MTDILEGMMTEEEFLQHMSTLTDDELQHYGVKGMRWGKRNPKNANYEDSQIKRDRQVYGTRGARRINRSLNAGNSISVARGDEKTRRDRVMGKNKYVRQGGKIAGAVVAGGLGFLGIRAASTAAASAAGRSAISKLFGSQASTVTSLISNPVVQGAAALGAAKIGEMFSGDIAVAANMRANGYDPSRR